MADHALGEHVSRLAIGARVALALSASVGAVLLVRFAFERGNVALLFAAGAACWLAGEAIGNVRREIVRRWRGSRQRG